VTNVLDQLRESHATWAPVERAVQLEDRVAIDVDGKVGDEPLIDRQDAEYVPRAEDPRPVPGFAEQLVGMNPGEEKQFTLHLPDDYADPDLAGKDASFQVKVHWVKEKRLPDTDDAFASTVGSFNSLDDLKEHVRGELRASAEATARRELQEGVIEAVVGVASLELPPQAITRHAARLRQQLAETLDNQGISVEQYRQLTGKTAAEFDEELTTQARRELTRLFVLEAIADAEDVMVDPLEVEAEIRRLVGDGPDARRQLRQALARPETRNRVEAVLRERKTITHLTELATGKMDGATDATPPADKAAEEPSHA
jgi:trigger factor